MKRSPKPAAGFETRLYSCYKASEGGMSQKDTMEYLRLELGLKVAKAYSPYVGQYGILITATAEDHEKASEWLFG